MHKNGHRKKKEKAFEIKALRLDKDIIFPTKTEQQTEQKMHKIANKKKSMAKVVQKVTLKKEFPHCKKRKKLIKYIKTKQRRKENESKSRTDKRKNY